MKVGVKNACLGAGWGGSGIAVGFSWFGERSGGMKLVERDVGERGFVGKWRKDGEKEMEFNLQGVVMMKRVTKISWRTRASE